MKRVVLGVLGVLAVVLLFAGCGGGAGTGTQGNEESGNEDKVTVTFLYNSYYDGKNQTFETKSVVKGRTVEKPGTDPSRSGYQFLGWFEQYSSSDPSLWRWNRGAGVKLFDFTQTIDTDVSVFARWDNPHLIQSSTDATLDSLAIACDSKSEPNRIIDEIWYEHEHGDLIRLYFAGSNDFINIIEIEIQKKLDNPVSFSGGTANEYVRYVFLRDLNIFHSWRTHTEARSGSAFMLTQTHLVPGYDESFYYYLLLYGVEGWSPTYEQRDELVEKGINKISFISYSPDVLELGSGTFWTPGRYYRHTKRVEF